MAVSFKRWTAWSRKVWKFCRSMNYNHFDSFDGQRSETISKARIIPKAMLCLCSVSRYCQRMTLKSTIKW